MSAETHAALEAALAAHVADVGEGRILSDYLIVVHAQDLDTNLSHYRLVLPNTQPFHAADGLLAVAERMHADTWADDDA